MKEDVEKSLPPKEEIIIEVALTTIQKQFYRAVYERNTTFLFKGLRAKCCDMICYAILYYAVLCYALLCFDVLFCSILYYVVLCCAVLCYTSLCFDVLCCAVLWCTVLCCYVLDCAVQYCAMLCYWFFGLSFLSFSLWPSHLWSSIIFFQYCILCIHGELHSSDVKNNFCVSLWEQNGESLEKTDLSCNKHDIMKSLFSREITVLQ